MHGETVKFLAVLFKAISSERKRKHGRRARSVLLAFVYVVVVVDD